MIQKFLVFQNRPREGPGKYLTRSAEKLNVMLDVVEPGHQNVPDINLYRGLIVLGEIPDADQLNKSPFLKIEKNIIRQFLEHDKPYLGFCLGHLLLAEVLGAEIGPNFCLSTGFIQGYLTRKGHAHPVFKDIPDSFPLFKWHTMAVLSPVPKHIDVLATSSECQVEAISIKDRPHIVGFQFNNQAAAVSDVKNMVNKNKIWKSENLSIDITTLLKETEKYAAIVGQQFELILTNYMKLVYS